MAITDGKYLTLIKSAEDYNKVQHPRWDTSIKQYKGEIVAFRNKKLKGWQHLIEVNLTRPTIDTMLPSIIFKTPKIFVRPATEIANQESSMQALQIENKFNAIINELNMARESKKAIKDALLLGVGFVKYGMTGDKGYDVDQHPFAAPFIKRSSPWETLIDPASRNTDLEDAEFVVFRNTIPLSRARKDKSLDRPERLQATGILANLPEHVKEDKTSKALSTYEFTTLYELWHRGEGVFAVLDETGKIYRKQEWPYDLGADYPLTVYSFGQVPEEFYTMGEPEHVYSLQLEASEKRTQQLNHTRRFNRKYFAHPDMPVDDRKALTEGEDGTVVVSAHPVGVLQDAPMSQDVANEYAAIMQELKEVTGISAYQRGGSESAVYSATAAKIIDNAANIRVDERREEVASAISHGARILYNIIREQQQWPAMAFNFIVDVASMQKPDDDGRRAQLLELGKILVQFPEFKRTEFLKDVALAFHKPPEQYLFTPEEVQQNAQNAPPPPEQQKMQMEMQKAQAEMQMKQQEMQLKAQMEQQKAQLELQKAQMEIQLQQASLELEKQKMMMDLQMERAKLQIEQQKMQIQQQDMREKADLARQNMEKEHQTKRRIAENDMVMKEKEHNANVQIQMHKVSQGSGGTSSKGGSEK